MNAQQILAKLDAATLTPTNAPDHRRVMADAANTLRSRIHRHEQYQRLAARLTRVQHPDSNQGSMEVASIAQDMQRIGPVDLAAAIAEASEIYSMWQ